MTARLVDVRTPREPAGVVVALHGGAARPDRAMVSPAQLSVLRMIPVARRIARTGRGRLGVVRLLNTYRGWDTEHTPLDDAAWALDRVRERWPGTPVALVGHSLGGRSALLSATDASVAAVVALNPWVYPDDGVALPGRRVLVVHGDEDRIAPPDRSRAVADRIRRLDPSAQVEHRTVEGGKHAMLRHGRAFEQAAAGFVTAALLTSDGARR